MLLEQIIKGLELYRPKLVMVGSLLLLMAQREDLVVQVDPAIQELLEVLAVTGLVEVIIKLQEVRLWY